jgi:hypothetical protein
MLRSRGSVTLAWIFFAVICIMAFYNAGLLLIQGGVSFHALGDILFALLPIIFALPAALIITRQPRNTIGWLLMIYPLVTLPSDAFTRYLSRYQTSPPPATLLNLFLVWVPNLSWMALIFPVFLVPLFFPTGRLISPRWRWTIYLTIGMTLFLMFVGAFSRVIQSEFASWVFVNPIGFISEEVVNAIIGPWSFLLAVLTVASVASVVVRYRRGSLIERQQIKWLLYACSLFGLAYIPGVFSNLGTSQWTASDLSNLLFALGLMMIPAAITAAIFRYHLYDIDIIIRRTLQYTLITLLLALVYLGSVILLQSVFRAIFSQAQDLSIVISTLIIATLFTPLRRRLQSFIDRRFFRTKYDADKIMASFGSTARSGVTMELLTQELLGVVEETMHPEQTSLWLRTIDKK